ncbi:hypothetical protein [Methylobacterium dankookense]|uniref:Uncharacterized protein n=2 Tax=Methylobacteriaceae TaxID=119045 RepID=A0A564FST0_9HYPH|nr:hypothetical protein [Methylobacterium dankookense]GJD54849.1 hypothetical protein IFDJLNFL_0728 [Methylobacterium dankookense]VUF11067.1 hypothetical protein MTDSW087_00740 [Methylobacterium dankookense]
MAGHARAATGEIGAGLMGALLAVDGAVRAAREQAAWDRAEARAEDAVHRLGQALLASRAREAELARQLAAARAEATGLRIRATRAEARIPAARRA